MCTDAFSIALTRTSLDVAAAITAVSCPEAGGVDLFLGTTRAESHPERGDLLALEYHAYEEMALREIRTLVDRAKAQWPILRLVLWHRLGVVRVAEPSVAIAVSCPHRAEAFAACRYLIDELKKSVPIWKRELYTRDSHWQGDL
jgi:molybdopterin synthase catalytic subunit